MRCRLPRIQLLMRRRLPFAAGLCLVGFVCTGCVDSIFSRSGGFDERPLAVQTVSLFNQRATSRLVPRAWNGDWILRRERLELIDQELRNGKPDLIFIQQAMEKLGSQAESDRAILSAGALADYDWQQQQVVAYPDTRESESLAVAVGLPAKFAPPESAHLQIWTMGKNGYLMAAPIEYGDQPVTLFNVQMPTGIDNGKLWFDFIQDRIRERVKEQKSCLKRVIVAGDLPADDGTKFFVDFLRVLALKDSSAGFCQVASRCYTATPQNDVFMATVGDENPARMDKILVHQATFVYASARNFEESDANNRYAHEFGLARLWPTQRFGWLAQLRLARCAANELEK